MPTGWGAGGVDAHVWLSVDRSGFSTQGSVYLFTVAAIDEPFDGPSDQLIFGRSTDGGVTWGGYIRVNDDPIDSPERHDTFRWFPTMSVAPNGRIDVIWNDGRASPLTPLTELYYSKSLDGGETWSEVGFDEKLIEPICQASFIRYTDVHKHDENRVLVDEVFDEDAAVALMNGFVRRYE